jgi:uncharacterized damage-inducible protein DinB
LLTGEIPEKAKAEGSIKDTVSLRIEKTTRFCAVEFGSDRRHRAKSGVRRVLLKIGACTFSKPQRYHVCVRTLFQALFRHQAWADAALLTAVHSHPESLRDEWTMKTLHHIVTVQRIFLHRFHIRPVDAAKLSQPTESFAELVNLYRTTHQEEFALVDGLSESDLERKFVLPGLQMHPTIAEGLTHVVMHSQNHRGQCLMRLREKGAKAPTLDYILWAKDHATPRWPEP